MKTVLASVSEKSGLVELLKVMQTFDTLRILATGSTARYLTESGIPCETVESLTDFPEILEGRVKTLHPKVFGGILAKDSTIHHAHLQAHQIPRIDVVIVNLYPFESVAKRHAPDEEVIENIDIGGVALIRAAAKNHRHVLCIPGPEHYPSVILALHEHQGHLPETFRRAMACRAFEKTTYYDALIAAYLNRSDTAEGTPNQLSLHFEKIADLRYGENPQQKAVWYHQAGEAFEKPFETLQGKPMSANNIVDAHAAYKLLREFPNDPACGIIKHNNPCGAAIGKTIQEAYDKAYQSDPVSAFGGVYGVNRPLTLSIAESLTQNFFEIVLAPDFEPEALEILARKKNVRVLKVPGLSQPNDHEASWGLKDLDDFGLILQENTVSADLPELTTVTQSPLPDQTRADVAFAWAIVKHLTSNAIVVVKNGQTVGFGIGQTSRIASMEIALRQAGDQAHGAVLASDGFFPATDNIDAAAQAGISVIIQPGGSLKDPEVIEAADTHGLVMVLTGERCFKH